MPIYEFNCRQCNTRFERLVRTMNGGQKLECPKCGSKDTSRTLSVFSVGAEPAKSSAPEGPICGRCGGPGPCAME